MTDKIKNLITKTNLLVFIKIFPFIFALHELEEWNVLQWHRRYQSNIPDVTDLHLRIIFILLIAALFLIFFFVLKIKNRRTVVTVLFPVFTLLLYNGIVHLYWSVYFKSYSPGLIFGFVISVPLIMIIIFRIISERLISKWVISLFGIIFTGMFVNVIFIGNKLEPGIVNAMLLGKSIALWIGL